MEPKLNSERLQRKALIYVRQSSISQVIHNLESQRRQYGLTDRAQALGFHDIEIIDEDLGRSGSGCVERPGFERLVTQVCSGEVGAVFCVEASRLARNGRDWHHLIDLCGLVGTVIVDPDGIYDPGVTNDRLLLGLKGTMSEFELNLIRQRSREAIQQKARRGELQFCLPAGLCWTGDHIELDPDRRTQQVLNLVFHKFQELGSVRQVHLWFCHHQLQVPARAQNGQCIWKIPRYNTVRCILSNPFYAGAYAFGRTATRTTVVDGRARKTKQDRRRHPQQWQVLIRDHHPGYITWEQYEANLRAVEANAHMKPLAPGKSGRGGRGLLAGLLRCRRCGRMLQICYSGAEGNALWYRCRSGPPDHPDCLQVSIAGRQADHLVAQQILQAVSANAIEAALQAAEQERQRQGQQRRSLEMGIEHARYQARLAERRYEAVDPAQRLVAGELEARWNQALERVRESEQQCATFDQRMSHTAIPSREMLIGLAQDLPAVWQTSQDMRLKQRIVHLVLREIGVAVDAERREVKLVLHWSGGQHSEVSWTKPRVGWNGRRPQVAVEVIVKMGGEYSDEAIAQTLNRQRLRTDSGKGWTVGEVGRVRQRRGIPDYQADSTANVVSLQQAAKQLQTSASRVLGLISAGILPARQITAFAPWQIAKHELESEAIQQALLGKSKQRRARGFNNTRQQDLFSDT